MLTIRYPLYAKMHILYRIYTKYSSFIPISFLRPNEPDTLFMSTNKVVIIRDNKSVVVFNLKVTIKHLMNGYEEESITTRQIILCRMPK